jgi:hypothetical protein
MRIDIKGGRIDIFGIDNGKWTIDNENKLSH